MIDKLIPKIELNLPPMPNEAFSDGIETTDELFPRSIRYEEDAAQDYFEDTTLAYDDLIQHQCKILPEFPYGIIAITNSNPKRWGILVTENLSRLFKVTQFTYAYITDVHSMVTKNNLILANKFQLVDYTTYKLRHEFEAQKRIKDINIYVKPIKTKSNYLTIGKSSSFENEVQLRLLRTFGNSKDRTYTAVVFNKKTQQFYAKDVDSKLAPINLKKGGEVGEVIIPSGTINPGNGHISIPSFTVPSTNEPKINSYAITLQQLLELKIKLNNLISSVTEELKNSVTDEITNRTNADSGLTIRLNDEITNRTNADSGLTIRLNDLSSSGSTSTDDITEIKEDIGMWTNSRDITEYISFLKSDVELMKKDITDNEERHTKLLNSYNTLKNSYNGHNHTFTSSPSTHNHTLQVKTKYTDSEGNDQWTWVTSTDNRLENRSISANGTTDPVADYIPPISRTNDEDEYLEQTDEDDTILNVDTEYYNSNESNNDRYNI